MQPKFIVIAIALFIGALLIFNVVNSRSSKAPEATIATVSTAPPDSAATTADKPISAQPLAQQPKAMIDKANNAASQVEAAAQSQADDLAKMDGSQ